MTTEIASTETIIIRDGDNDCEYGKDERACSYYANSTGPACSVYLEGTGSHNEWRVSTPACYLLL